MSSKDRHITIIRHAAAAYAQSGNDFDRPLSERGALQIRDCAGKIGRGLPSPPERVICSSAVRAKQTLEMLSREIQNWTIHPIFDEVLYHCGPRDVAQMISGQPDDIKHIMVVGHNPTVSELAIKLLGRRIVLSTLGVVCIRLKSPAWSDCFSCSPKLVFSLSAHE